MKLLEARPSSGGAALSAACAQHAAEKMYEERFGSRAFGGAGGTFCRTHALCGLAVEVRQRLRRKTKK